MVCRICWSINSKFVCKEIESRLLKGYLHIVWRLRYPVVKDRANKYDIGHKKTKGGSLSYHTSQSL